MKDYKDNFIKEKYIAWGVCIGLLTGVSLGIIAGVLTKAIAIVLPVVSGIGLLSGLAIALYLVRNSKTES